MKLGAASALAVGYVLGTRAGRGRYEQIRKLASEAAERLEAYGAGGTLARWAEQARPAGDARARRG